MSNVPIKADAAQVSILFTMARRFSMEPGPFEATVRKACNAEKLSREEFAAFLLVAHEHGLNPVTKEVFAFPGKNGVVPVVSIDGWLRIINSHPQMDGLTLEDIREEGKLVAVCASIFRKDRSKPISVTEYLNECQRGTEPWQKWPARMLRHKATIQAARYAFGFAGVYDSDEAERIDEAQIIDAVPQIAQKSAYQARKDGDWQKLVTSLQECETQDEVAAWETAWADEIKAIPLQWQFELSEAKEKHIEVIAAREEADRKAERAMREHV